MAFDLKNIFSSISAPEDSSGSRVVGVDIGSASIKVVELERTEKAITLRTYGELQLGPYADKPLGEIVTLANEKATEALVDVVRESSVHAKIGVLALPLDSSFVTVVPVALGDDDVENKVHVEARKYIPVPLADVMLDWTVLGEYGGNEQRISEVLLAAIQTEAFHRYKALMMGVELGNQPAEIEVFSTIRGTFRPDDTSLAIIDLGAETSKLYIVKDGSLQRIHRVYDGGAACTRRLAKMLNVSFDEAEKTKRNYKGKHSQHAEDVRKAYISSLERSGQEFKRVIDQYEARAGEPIGRVVLTGGGAAFPNAHRYVSDLLQKEVIDTFPFEKIAYPAFMEDTLKEVSSIFATAFGAALRMFESVE